MKNNIKNKISPKIIKVFLSILIISIIMLSKQKKSINNNLITLQNSNRFLLVATTNDDINQLSTSTVITELQNTLTNLENKASSIENSNTTQQDFLKSYPVGSIFITTSTTSPSTYGGNWEKYAQGRTLIGVGSTTDEKGTTSTFINVGSTGGEYNQALLVGNIPSHNHTLVAKGSVNGTVSISGTTSTNGDHNHTQAAHNHVMDRRTFTSDWGHYDTALTYHSNGYYAGVLGSQYYTTYAQLAISYSGSHSHTVSGSGNVSATFHGSNLATSSSGSGSAFNIQNPYIVVYMWHRTA